MKTVCALLCCLVALSAVGASTSVAQFHLLASPSNVIEGVHSLTVKCTFPDVSTAGVATLVSLVLSHRTPGSHNFNNVASIMYIKPHDPVTSTTWRATVTGNIASKGDSYLQVLVPKPDRTQEGVFVCNYHALNQKGEPVTENRTVSVVTQTDLEVCLQQVAVTGDLAPTLDRINDMAARSKEELIYTGTYGNHLYYMSIHISTSPRMADNLCRNYPGSRLLQINTQDEFEAVKKMFTGMKKATWCDAHTANASVSTDEWYSLYSVSTPVHMVWQGQFPVAREGYNCAEMRDNYEWKMANVVCSDKALHYACEVEI